MMDSIHPGQQSPPSLRSLQPAILHHFHHTQEDQALGSVQALAAAAGAFGLHPADQTSLLQQGFLSQVSDPSRSLRQPGAYVDQHGRPSSHLDTISNLQQQSFLPTAPNVTQFGFGPAQSQPFGLGNFARPQASEHVQIQEPGPTAGDEADANAAKDDNHPNPVPNPPGLAAWRDRLFYLDETIVMTEDQYVGKIHSAMPNLIFLSDSRPTGRMLTMSIRIARRSDTSESHSSRTTGTAVSKDVHRELPSRMIPTRRNANASRVSAISAMSRSRLLNTSPELQLQIQWAI